MSENVLVFAVIDLLAFIGLEPYVSIVYWSNFIKFTHLIVAAIFLTADVKERSNRINAFIFNIVLVVVPLRVTGTYFSFRF